MAIIKITPQSLASDAVETAKINDDAVTTAKVLDNNVTLAKLGDGTQGDILYYGASGAPARLGFGTSGDFLKTQGTGANPTWAAAGGGALSLITAATFGPSSDTFIISTLGSGYDEHKLVIALNYPDSVGSAGYLYLYLSTGGAYVTGKCSYAALASFSHTTGISENKGEEVDFIKCTSDGMREDMWHIVIIDFVNLLNTKTKSIRLQDAGSTMDYDYRINNYSGSALLNDAGVTDAIKLVDSAGHNIEGSYQLYGFSKT